MMGFNLQLGDALRSESVTAIDDAIRAIARQEIDRTPRTKFCDACAYMHQPEISARCCCVACHGDDVPAWAQRMTTPPSSEKTGEGRSASGSTGARTSVACDPSLPTPAPSPASPVKPCPFCGGPARLVSHESPEVTNYGYEVHCDKCGAMGPSADCEWDGNSEHAKRDAIEAWNRRTPAPSPASAQGEVCERAGSGSTHVDAPASSYCDAPLTDPAHLTEETEARVRQIVFEQTGEAIAQGARAYGKLADRVLELEGDSFTVVKIHEVVRAYIGACVRGECDEPLAQEIKRLHRRIDDSEPTPPSSEKTGEERK